MNDIHLSDDFVPVTILLLHLTLQLVCGMLRLIVQIPLPLSLFISQQTATYEPLPSRSSRHVDQTSPILFKIFSLKIETAHDGKVITLQHIELAINSTG
jgi:hypothetical protein